MAASAIAILLVPASAAAAPKDYAGTALNIIPSGQLQPGQVGLSTVPNDRQAQMYDQLTPLFDKVQESDLTTYFKSEALNSVGTDGPGIPELIPGHPEIEITRDKYGVPHVQADSHDGGVFAAGWIAAEDRGLLLEQARYNGRIAAIDAPGLSAIGLITSLAQFEPSAQTEAELAKQTQALKAEGKEGAAVLHDIDVFIDGINAYLSIHSPSTEPWTRNDVYALNAVKDQFLGEGGGDEARRTQFLSGLQERLGKKKGMKVFNDLRQFKNNGSPTSIDGRFPYGKLPKKAKGNVIIDPGSYTSTPAVQNKALVDEGTDRAHASNTLMITKKHSATGKPLMVGGPQIGYFYPGLTYEIDMNAGDLVWRGATSAPFPGYLLIGRGEDFATTLTSAGADVIDQFAEKLCGGSDTKYVYKGKCREMGTFDAGVLNGTDPVTYKTTVHGPVIGYATVKGKKVAISMQRSSYGKDVLDLLYNRRLSNGQVHDPKSFFRAAAKTPQTFNSFYIDSKHVAEFTAGLLPVRDKAVDPGLLTNGNGKFEWTGFIKRGEHPQGIDPKDGTMTNWNNGVAHGFGAADDDWGRNGSAQRVDMLNQNLEHLAVDGKWSLATVTSAMNAGATQDVRAIDTVPLLKRVLRGSKAPSERAQQMLDLLVKWRNNGGSRLDRDGDGLIDAPGAAIIDGSWTNLADAVMKTRLGPQLDELDSLFSRFDQPPGGQFSGWYQYMDRDFRALLGRKMNDAMRVSYCGKGKLKACQKSLWSALDRSGDEIAADQGTEDPAAWRASANDERIQFRPLPLREMRYTNRPSGIQQVISFDGHR
jgi:acyl-homoserine lactone acylase PvdQ